MGMPTLGRVIGLTSTTHLWSFNLYEYIPWAESHLYEYIRSLGLFISLGLHGVIRVGRSSGDLEDIASVESE